MKKHYIKKALTYSTVGSLGLTVAVALQGCGDTGLPPEQSQSQNNQAQIANAAEEGLFMVIQQTGTNPDTYELAEKYPSAQGTRAILKDMEGNERILSEEELKQMAEAEAARVESGESQLAQPEASNQGLSLGETILASAAGALIGGMIANKLMGNSNFQKNQQAVNQRAQSSMSSTRNPAAGSNNAGRTNSGSQPRSGFFGGSQGGSRSNSSLGG
jgi:hypothetical protein